MIAKVFTQMGIVEELGSGTRKMFKYTPIYAKGKEPIIEEQDIYRVEIPYIPTLQATDPKSSEKSREKSSEKNERKVLEALKNDSKITILELEKNTGISNAGVRKILNRLKSRGVIQRVGPDRGGYWNINIQMY